MTGTALIPVSSTDLVERFPSIDENAMEAYEENLGGEDLNLFDLDKINIPGSGITSWQVPGLGADVDSEKFLRGVIIAKISRRSFWEQSMEDSGGGTAPDCASDDSVFGRGLYGVGSDLHPKGDCKTCPMNQWVETPSGRKKRCGEQSLVIFLREGDILPVVIQLPVSSLAPMRKFNVKLTSKQIPFYRAVVDLALEKRDKPVAHSVVDPSLVEVVDEAAGASFKALGQQVEAAYRAQTGTAAA